MCNDRMNARIKILTIHEFNGDCCTKANRCIAFGIRLRSHTEVCSRQTSPSAPCASSFLQSQDNLASKIVQTVDFCNSLFNGNGRNMTESWTDAL